MKQSENKILGDGTVRWPAASRAIAWAIQEQDAVDLAPHETFVPNGAPPGLDTSRNPIWKVPGLNKLVRPIRLTKGRLLEHRSKKIQSVLDRTGMVFVHVPKNAGSSVSERLYGQLLGHHSMQFLSAALPRHYLNRAFRFAILRDPNTRLLSAYTYLKTMPTSVPDMRFREECLSDVTDFSAFLGRLEDPDFRLKVMRWHHFREQCAFLSDRSGKLLVDVIFSMDHMSTVEDMLAAALGERRRIAKTNASTPQQSRSDVSDEQRRLVSDVYGQDLVLYSRLSESTKGVARTSGFFERHGSNP
ncbi:MAG: sulfotransferase family 2 domain-containing protein [Pseudomonadota bacterium]